MGFPPAEERIDSLAALGLTDTFGAGWRTQHLLHLQELESNSTQSMFIILSEVHIDKPQILEKILEVLQGFEGSGGNIVFILIGNFITKPIDTPGGRESAINSFKALADVILTCPQLANEAKFVLVPGIYFLF